jgi:hypothetical protein
MVTDEVGLCFGSVELTDGEREYLAGQSERIRYTRDIVQSVVDGLGRQADILDVGPHFLTRFLIDTLTPAARFSTLGQGYDKIVPSKLIEAHFEADLNDCASLALPDLEGKFDIIVLCEVVEHLFIPPEVVFRFLSTFLKKDTGRIVVGTPNAVCLSNRIRMMMGENPFHRLSPDWRSGAGHIREYTMQELREYGSNAGLSVEREEYCSYWGHQILDDRISVIEEDVPSYRTGITMVYGVRR